MWTGKLDLNMDTCERGNFLTRKEQVADSKTSGYVWTGLRFIHNEFFLQRRVVQSWVKITQCSSKFEFRYESLKSKFRFVLFII